MPDTRGRHAAPGHAKRTLGWLAVIGVIVGAALVVATFAFSLVVDGESMQPTLRDGDRVLLDPRPGIARIERFDVVHALVGPGRVSVVKRVAGLPGDRVAIRPGDGERSATVWVQPGGKGPWQAMAPASWSSDAVTRPCCAVNGTSSASVRVATVPAGHVFLLGDNLGHSDDSRVFGWVSDAEVRGRFVLRLAPFGDIGRLPSGPALSPAHDAPPGHASAS